MSRTMTRGEVLGIFEAALDARSEIDALGVLRSHMADGAHGYGMGPMVSNGGTSTPTERQGEALADRRDEWDAEERRLRERVDLARELCVGLSRSMGVKFGAVMELRYLSDMPWKQVASALDVSRSTVLRLRDAAVGEVAERGTAYLRELARGSVGERGGQAAPLPPS